MSRHLVSNVHVDGKWYGPDHGCVEPPAEVADAITNPEAWSDPEPEPERQADEPKAKAESPKPKRQG